MPPIFLQKMLGEKCIDNKNNAKFVIIASIQVNAEVLLNIVYVI